MTSTPAPDPDPDPDTAGAVLDRAAARTQDVRIADAALMLTACEWADLHPADALSAATIAGYGDTALKLAGSHAPMVTEFAVTEFAARLGRSTTGGAHFLGESLVCRHLLPGLWEAVQAGLVDGWRARLVARMVLGRDLTPDAAGFVDRHVTPVAQSIGAVALERLVAEAFTRFMPDEAELAREEAKDRRHFTVHLGGRATDDLSGTVDATGTFDLPDGIVVHDAVVEEKARLRALGASDQPGPLSAQALLNLVVRGSDGASAQGTLDLHPDEGEPDPNPGGRPSTRRQGACSGTAASATSPGGRAASASERVETPAATRNGGRRQRRYLLHLHLSDAVLASAMFPGREGAGDAAVGRVEETKAPVVATAIRDWLGATGVDGSTAQITVLPVLDLAEAVHTEAYEVPRRLQAQTALTHLTCVFPWCGRAARRCDHDHAVPFDPGGPTGEHGSGQGGPTCSCNISPLCRSHHRLKTHGHAATRWTITPAGAGAWLWTSPHGAHYLRDHTGTRPLDGPLATRSPPGDNDDTNDTGPPGDAGNDHDTGPPDTEPPAAA